MITQTGFHSSVLAVTWFAVLGSGCTHEQIYDSTKELRAQDCQRLAERERYDCEQHARSVSYKQYREEREGTAKDGN